MIKAYINNGVGDIQFKGTVSTQYADTMIIIEELYNGLKEDDPELAESYKRAIIRDIETAFMTNEERHEYLMRELLNVMHERFEENELIQELKDLKKSEME